MIKTLFFLIFSFSIATFAQAGELAPPWQLTTQDGKPISLEQYKNKPVILHFWATWCPYCKRLQPKLSELQKKYQASGIEIVSISFNEDEGAKPQDEIYARGYDFITAVRGEAVASLYGVRGTPTTFFIKRSGEVIYRSSSSDISNPKLELAVQEIVKN
ncbi:TlpA family protein disulfide reductase [Thalassomonas haliotis]|uniref:TlpA family protein disulfide reductase n=1 Tax=Thalassomonas haliotis TaxID=485448 RepID=A0ABY7VAP7_9GAMM|nr:TlpA disulfide reductase family protein [Thalassomonas haliotis]WDE10729.1 TlpA family protein disulfide reductase [Thalassomonas haliotis]